jgi:protein AATF/BFR2
MKELEIERKKDIDTKATKGRKIKYLVHDKLLNFMAPSENHTLLPGKNSIINNMFGIQNSK